MRRHGGPFGETEAAHLLRRAAFAPRVGEARQLAALGLEAAVERVLGPQTPRPHPEAAALEAGLRSSGEADALAGAWLLRLGAGPDPLREHLVLFFHNHFVSALQKVRSGRMMLDQLALFRRLGQGPFPVLVRAVSRDPAMVIYLDLFRSTRDQPNENFARELMELFTMGTGPYAERDVQEAARAFTGYELRGERFRFSQAAHDDGTKTVLGASGALDGDAVVKLCSAHPATAVFMATKLAREFLADTPRAQDVAAIAAAWRASGGELRAVLRTLLGSEAFYASTNRFAVTRSPAALAAAVMRSLDLRPPLAEAARQVRIMGQALLDPPTVKGWEGGRAWLNPATWLARRSFLLEAGRLAAEAGALPRITDAGTLEGQVRGAWRHLLGSDPSSVDIGRITRALGATGGDPRTHLLACLLAHPDFQRS